MISVRLAGSRVDVTNLTWSASDPGGFETCSFSVDGHQVKLGDEILILDGTQVCWHGYVEEPGISDLNGHRSFSVMGVGYSATLKRKQWSMIYIDRALSAWQPPSLQRTVNLDGAWVVMGFEVQADTDSGSPGIKLEVTSSVKGTSGILCEAWYDAGPENLIDSIIFASGVSAGGCSVALAICGTDTAGAPVDSLLPSSGLTIAETLFRGAHKVRYAVFQGISSVVTTIPRFRTVSKVAVIGTHGLELQGVSDGRGFFPSQIALDALTRSGQIIDVGQVDQTSRYILTHSEYRSPTTSDVVVGEMATLMGWHWGVWEPKNTLSRRPTFYFTAPPKSATCAVRYDHFDTIELTEKLSSMQDEARVIYTLPSGSRGSIEVQRSHSRLPDGVHQGSIIDVGTVGAAATAQALGTVELALQQQQSRVAGQGQLPIALQDGRPSHLLRPGRDRLRIIGFPQTGGLLAGPPVSVDTFHVKRISVTVDNGAPKTQIEFDYGADLLEVLQARLAVNANLG